MADSRYQFQPWYIKTYRWLRWKPLYSLLAVRDIAGWVLRGARPLDVDFLLPGVTFTRWQTLCSLWTMWQASADMRLGNYSTGAEFLEEIRARWKRVKS